jgi:hypothetical protein
VRTRAAALPLQILIRDPYSVIKSFGEVLQPTLTESCYPALCEIFSALRTRGSPPIVVMSEQLGANPEVAPARPT